MFKKIYWRIKNYFETPQGTQVMNRFKSFAWRLGWMLVSAVVAWLLMMVTEWNISGSTQVLLGLILGELSKFIREIQLLDKVK
jgi:hypothetical protein